MKLPPWPNPEDKFLHTSNLLPQERMDNLATALKLLGDPHKKLKNLIHITGTNGKGSVSKLLHFMLLCSGFSVATCTSPHLVDYNERFLINNFVATDEEIIIASEKVKNVVQDKIRVNFFDITFMIGMLILSKKDSDFNIIEVGIGSRFDSTGMLTDKLLSITTSISLDHTELLGKTVKDIAREKSKIISFNGVNFSAKQTQCAEPEIKNEARRKSAKYFSEGCNWGVKILKSNPLSFHYISKEGDGFNSMKRVKTNFLTRQQCQNAALAISVYQYISKNQPSTNFSEDNLRAGILEMEHRCRFETRIANSLPGVTFLIDGAHNEGGIKMLFQHIKRTRKKFRNNLGVFAMLKSKNLDSIIPKLRALDRLFLYMPHSIKDFKLKPFYQPEEVILKIKEQAPDLQVSVINSWEECFCNVNRSSSTRVVFFGSLIFVGAIKEILDAQLDW